MFVTLGCKLNFAEIIDCGQNPRSKRYPPRTGRRDPRPVRRKHMQRHRPGRQERAPGHTRSRTPVSIGHHHRYRMLRPAQARRSGRYRGGRHGGRHQRQAPDRRISRQVDREPSSGLRHHSGPRPERIHAVVLARRPHTLFSQSAGRLRLLVQLLYDPCCPRAQPFGLDRQSRGSGPAKLPPKGAGRS